MNISTEKSHKKTSIHALEGLNFFVADVQNGMGPYVTLFLKSSANWNPGQIGIVMAIGNIAGVIAQTPAGALIDHLRSKRWLLIGGVLLITIACLAIIFMTTMPVVSAAQAGIGIAGAIFPPALAALALGLVGRKMMDRQYGKNQAINSAGNVFAAIMLGLVGYYLGLKWMFYVIPLLCFAAIACLLQINDKDIDYQLSRGGDDGDKEVDCKAADSISGIVICLKELWQEKQVRIFLICVVLFHFSNAALVPLVIEFLTKGTNAHHAALYITGFMVGSQLVFVLVGALSGYLAGKWGRKPLFLIAFAALIVRAVLFTSTSQPYYLIGIQTFDGLGAGIFGVVSVLIIADLTKGTGRFNTAQGAVATATGIGAFLSNMITGQVVKYAGYTTGFYGLAIIGAIGLTVFWMKMPETLNQQHKEDGNGNK